VTQAAACGITTDNVRYEYAQMAARKDAAVETLRGGVEHLLKKAGVTLIRGKGVLAGAHEIRVDGQKRIEADHIVIATGSRPASIPVPGIETEGVIDSDDVLALTEAPQPVVIIGGGVIGIEFATLFNTLGKKVTVVEMQPQILPGLDAEIASMMKDVLHKRGIAIHTSARVGSIDRNSHVICRFEQDGKELTAEGDVCIVAAGRKPNTKDIGLEAAGVALDRGFIAVDERMCTNVPGVYAVGDITGHAMLAHVASAQGIAAAHHIAGRGGKMRYDIVPSCIYTSPEMACVGLCEQTARERGYTVKTGRFPVSANGKSLVTGETSGMVKIVTDAGTGEILGAQMMAPRATDMIAEVCAAMRAEATIEELAYTIHPHPTFSEMIMEAAHDVGGLSVHMPKR
jgi:dihydrolipoamide dehydrogenase